MVNPNSDLYRKHPDWVLTFTGRSRSEGRNQLVLNLARPDVRAYVFQVLDKLLNENDIVFLKWDYNATGQSRVGRQSRRRIRKRSTSITFRISTPFLSNCARSILTWRLRVAPAAEAASTWASCATKVIP